MGTPVNPEDAVIDAIDALVDEQLAGGPVDDYSVDRYDRCRICKQGWHGLPNDVGCPGIHARGYQIREWKRKLLAHPCARQPYMPRSFVDMQAARLRERVDQEMLRGPLAAARASAQPPSRPAYQVWRCPTCQTTVARGQHCACPRNWQRPLLPSQLVREWCSYCSRVVREGEQCNCPQSRMMRGELPHGDLARWTQRCAYCDMERPMEQQECDCPPNRMARSLAQLTATSSLGSEAAQIAASGAEIIAQDAQPWIPEAEVWEDQEPRG